MVGFKRGIADITDINDLLDLKEELKSQTLHLSLHWEARMNLYTKVQLINERIEQLKDNVR